MSEPKQTLEEFLFEAASMKLDPEERHAFLDGVCRDASALRARLELLLEGHFQGEGFLTNPSERAALPTEPSPPEPPASGIERYQLLEKIGEGGFGEVWMADQKEPVKRRVAVKILKLGMDTRQVIGRFEAERQALALMDHPNIAKVLDAGTTEASIVGQARRRFHYLRPAGLTSSWNWCAASKSPTIATRTISPPPNG